MIEEILPKAAEQQRIEMNQADKAQAPTLSPVPSQVAPEEIEAIDELFKRQQDDPAANAIALWALAPLVAELMRDHFKKDEEPKEEKKQSDPSAGSEK